MPASTRDEALATIIEYAEAAQHTNLGEFHWGSDLHGNRVKGYAFKNAMGTYYRVYGPTDHQYMMVTYEYKLIPRIANQLDEATIDRYLDTPVAYTESDDEDESTTAARAFLDSIDADTNEEIQEELNELLSPEGVLYEIQTTRNDSVYRLLLHRRIFPYHSGFTPDAYMSSIGSVTIPGIEAAKTLLDKVDLSDIKSGADQEVEDSAESSDSDDLPHDRMFK